MDADASQMEKISDLLPTKAAKIRALDRAGYARADIARFLGIRYQHVRNVLTQIHPASAQEATASRVPQGFSEDTPEWSMEVARQNLEVSADGSLHIPNGLLDSAEIKPGDTVLARVVDGELRISSYSAALDRAQWFAKHFIKPGASEVDDFIAERRAAGARGD